MCSVQSGDGARMSDEEIVASLLRCAPEGSYSFHAPTVRGLLGYVSLNPDRELTAIFLNLQPNRIPVARLQAATHLRELAHLAERGDVQRLEISGADLSDMSRDYFSNHFSTLRDLQLTHCKAPSGWAPSLYGMSQLQRLNLSCCMLDTFPDVSAGLPALTDLVVTSNRFELPSALPQLCPELTTLVANSMCWRTFPTEAVCGLTNLARLELGSNAFPEVPRAICNLTHLKHLRLNAWYGENPRMPRSLKPLQLESVDMSGIRVLIREPGGSSRFEPAFDSGPFSDYEDYLPRCLAEQRREFGTTVHV